MFYQRYVCLTSITIVSRFPTLAMLCIIFVAAICGFCIVQKIQLYFERRSIMHQHGCQSISQLLQMDYVLGLDTLFESYSAFKNNIYLQLMQQRFAQTGNTFTFKAFGKTEINTCDPENIKTILSDKFKDFGMGPTRTKTFEPLIGHGILTSDGRSWEQARKIIKPSFARRNLMDLTMFEGHVQELLAHLPTDCDREVDMSKLFFDLTIKMAVEFFFGPSECSSGAITSVQFAAAFDRGQTAVTCNFALGLLARLIPDAQFDKDCMTVKHFVKPYVQKALRSTESALSQKPNFLTSISQQTQNPELLTGALLNILLGGRDTTASLLSNLFFVLSRNQRVLRRLQTEISAANINGLPTLADIRGLKYLQNCINESLRLHPPIPRNSRTALRDTVLPQGGGKDGNSPIFVAAGTQVGYNIFAMHRLESIYGADAAEFRPERWENKDLKPGWAHLPFNGGPRICIGQQFAMNEVSYVVVRLLQELKEVRAVNENEDWLEGLGLTCSTKNGTLVTVVKQ